MEKSKQVGFICLGRKEMGKMTLKVLGIFFLFILSATVVMAQEVCEGNFDCDQDVDGTDAAVFKSDFGRSPFFEPCDTCNDSPCPCKPCPYGMVDCGTKCVDPLTDEDFCGVDSACLGGTICGASERCIAGICEYVGGCSYPASLPKTGQTTTYVTRDDGDLKKGVSWPNPRFTDNGDGTVADNLTGLIWLKNANCFGLRTWDEALSVSNGLENGECGLSDGSNAGNWRLPNGRELFSLIDDEQYNPALPSGHPFTNVQSDYYWSSTSHTFGSYTHWAWDVSMSTGIVNGKVKSDSNYVWPVRGGQ